MLARGPFGILANRRRLLQRWAALSTAAAATAGLARATHAQANTKQVISTSAAGRPDGAYSQGFRVGDFVYTAGTGPIDPRTSKIAGDTIEEQTRLTLDNIKAVLEAGGATMDDVFKVTVYLADPEMFSRFNAVYAEYFTDPQPARSVAGVSLAQVPGLLIELDAVAYVGDK